MRLSDLIHTNVRLLRVLFRFDIHPGFGDRTVEEACRERCIDPEFFIEIVNVYHDALYFPETRLRQLDVRAIVAYLKKAHHDYATNMLPAVGRLVEALVESAEGRNAAIGMIGRMYDDYHREFLHHIAQEEELVFPYALRVDEAFRNGASLPQSEHDNIRAIRNFTSQHSHMEEKLLDLQNLLIKYIEPPFDIQRCHAVIFELQQLEQDLIDHARIEDRILFAVTGEMESALERASK